MLAEARGHGPTLPLRPVIARRLVPLAVSGTLLALVATGCAQSNSADEKEFTGEQGRVASTVRSLDDAYTDEVKDDTGARTVCRTLLSKRLIDQLSRDGGCEKNARAALKNSDPTQLDVRNVTIAGDVATVEARVTVPGDFERIDTLKLIRESNTWKFDGSTVGPPQKKS
jgi:hypothetical protein